MVHRATPFKLESNLHKTNPIFHHIHQYRYPCVNIQFQHALCHDAQPFFVVVTLTTIKPRCVLLHRQIPCDNVVQNIVRCSAHSHECIARSVPRCEKQASLQHSLRARRHSRKCSLFFQRHLQVISRTYELLPTSNVFRCSSARHFHRSISFPAC